MNIVAVALGVAALILITIMYIRARRMLQIAQTSTYAAHPPCMHTDYGEVRPLHFHSKEWRTKKWMTFISAAVIAVVLTAIIIFDATPNVMYFYWAFLLPWMHVIREKVPSFFIVKDGMYLNEKYFEWRKVHSYQILRVSLGDEMYGMFENSSEFYRIQFEIGDKFLKTSSVYIHEAEDITALTEQFASHNVPERIPENQPVIRV